MKKSIDTTTAVSVKQESVFRTARSRVSLTVSMLAIVMMLCLVAGALRPSAQLHQPSDVGYIPCAEALNYFAEIRSPQYFVYSVDSGEFVGLRGENERVYPASATKLLTILYALTLIEPAEEVTPGNELTLVGEGSSIAYVKSNHTLTVSMLIEGMLLPSGNDAAYALAAAVGYKLAPDAADGIAAVEAFMKGMNAYAAEIGLCGSYFTVPDGLAGGEHYSTLEDMAIVASMAAENELIMSYASLAEDDVVYASGHSNHWVNTNLLLDPESEYFDSRVDGLKTGSIDGNYNLICSAEQDGERYVIGLFGGSDKEERFADASRILDQLFESDRFFA